MKRIAHILKGTALFLVITTGMITLKSCGNDDLCKNIDCKNGGTCIAANGSCDCVFPYGGTFCGEEIRKSYYATYAGTGTDSKGFTYTNWTATFTELGTDASMMKMTMRDSSSNETFSFDVTLYMDESGNIRFNAAPYTRQNVNETVSGTGLFTLGDVLSFTLKVQRPGQPEGKVEFKDMKKVE